MRRKSLFLVMALALLALPLGSRAHAAGWLITANGGTSIPTGDFSDEQQFDAQLGWQAGGSVDYLFNDMWALGIDGSWNESTHGAEGETIQFLDENGNTLTGTLDEGKYKTWQVGAHGKYMFPVGTNPLKPYGLVGLGAYDTKGEFEATSSGTAYSFEDETDTRFGGKIGLGAMWMASNIWGIGVEADYNFISEDEDKTDVSSLQYAGVRGAVSFKIPMGQSGQ